LEDLDWSLPAWLAFLIARSFGDIQQMPDTNKCFSVLPTSILHAPITLCFAQRKHTCIQDVLADLITPTTARERFFIIKSWNLQNVIEAQRDSVWETQEKNTRLFTDAFHACRSVVLLFSVNKSMAFQGAVSTSLSSYHLYISLNHITGSHDIPTLCLRPPTTVLQETEMALFTTFSHPMGLHNFCPFQIRGTLERYYEPW
jgi:hypothetical protein